MLSEQDIEEAHPEAFDFVFGNLPPGKVTEFSEHLETCRHCQGVVAEYGEIGQIIQQLPPHAEPPAALEDRTVTAMMAALAGENTEAHQIPQAAAPARRPDLAATQAYQVPHREPPAEAPAPVTSLPRWRKRLKAPGWGWAAATAAAILIVVGIVIFRPHGGPTVVTPLHATAAAKRFGAGGASGEVTARPAGPSWTFTLVVHGLKPLPGNEFYECWWATPGSTKAHPALATGGSFVVGTSGSATLTMTTGVDPRRFSTMEITAQSPGRGALHGPVLLTGKTA